MLKKFGQILRIITLSTFILSASCSDAGDLLSLAFDPPSRKPIDKSIMGLNNFFVDREFGSIPAQYSEIKNTLGLKYIRILVAWTDEVQPTPNSAPNFNFYDDIINSAPPGVELLVVLSHVPRWMANPANWINGDPRTTFVERWVKPAISRYKNSPSVNAFEIFNEPDVVSLEQDAALGLTEPANYFDLLVKSYQAGKSIAGNKLVIMAATTSIQRNFPNVLRYNQALRDLGADSFTDKWNVHYYSSSYETVVTKNGIADFLNGISKPIWITESGQKGPNNQLSYVETTWPFLQSKINDIERFYYYQFGETGPLETNFGLRTTDPSFPVSDLYLFLRDGTR